MHETDELVDCLADNPAMCSHAEDASVTIVSATAAGTGAPRPVKLPCASVTPGQAALSRMIGCGCSIEMPDAGALLSLHLAQNAEADWIDAVMLAGPFGSIELAEGPRLMRALTGIDLSAEMAADDERWEWLQAALVARLAGTPFAGTECLTRGAQQESHDACTLRITLQTGGHAIMTHARAEAASWLEFLSGAAWTRARRPFADFADLPFESVLRVARHTLPRHALKGLATGDLILPDEVSFGTRGAGYIQLGVLYARVRYQEPNTFRITNAEVRLDSLELKESRQDDAGGAPPGEQADAYAAAAGESAYMDEPEPEREPLADAAALDSVPVTLNFELGKVRMSLGELRALALETIITFNGSSSSISIRCGDRLMGRGELVDVSGRLGVRILEWGPKC
jgi:type III secretion protein Q